MFQRNTRGWAGKSSHTGAFSGRVCLSKNLELSRDAVVPIETSINLGFPFSTEITVYDILPRLKSWVSFPAQRLLAVEQAIDAGNFIRQIPVE